MSKERLLKGWEVEWCVDVPVVDGDADLDNADMRSRDFPSRTKAKRFAKRMVKEDWFGSVCLTQFEMQPFEPGYPGLTREYIADSEYIE